MNKSPETKDQIHQMPVCTKRRLNLMRWSHEGPGQWSKTSRSFALKVDEFSLRSPNELHGIIKRRRRRRRNRRLITLLQVKGGTHFPLLSSTRGWMWWTVDSERNAAAAEQLRLQRSSPGFSLTVTQDGPQFRTQRLGQTSRRCSLSPRMIHSFSIHTMRPCFLSPSPLCIFPSASPSSVCISFHKPPTTTSLAIHPPSITIMIISVPT